MSHGSSLLEAAALARFSNPHVPRSRRALPGRLRYVQISVYAAAGEHVCVKQPLLVEVDWLVGVLSCSIELI